jgi:hypothetical protein
MTAFEARLPVLLIHNIDPTWESSEKQEAVQGTHEIDSAVWRRWVFMWTL